MFNHLHLVVCDWGILRRKLRYTRAYGRKGREREYLTYVERIEKRQWVFSTKVLENITVFHEENFEINRINGK
jgi:hypothetical protein